MPVRRPQANCRNERDSGRRTRVSKPPQTSRVERGSSFAGNTVVTADRHNHDVELGRIAWICTVITCLVTVAILLIDGYYGYAEVTFAVAVAAAINLS